MEVRPRINIFGCFTCTDVHSNQREVDPGTGMANRGLRGSTLA